MTAPALPPSTTAVSRHGDWVAPAALLVGAAIALAGLRTPVLLAIGAATAAAGLLLALRGARPVPAPSLLALALGTTAAATLATGAIAVYEDWQLGVRLADGASFAELTAVLVPYERATAALRALGTFAAGSLLLGAAVARFSGK